MRRIALIAILWLAPALAQASPCTLMSVTKGSAADLVVYFTKFIEEDHTAGRYKKCRLVTKQAKGTQTFKVTPFRQDASVVVHRRNWPR